MDSPLSVTDGVASKLRRSSLYYGWNIVFALAITEMTSWGILYYAFSVILKPLQQELGWDQGTITGAFSLAILVSGLAAIPVGQWLDRYGARAIMTLGSAAGVLLVLAWSQVTTLAGFYVVWLLMGVTLATVLYEPAFTVVAQWFNRNRARALTLLTFGGGLASVIYAPLTQWLVTQYGWRSALMMLAVILGCITIPLHAFVLRRRPEDIGTVVDGSRQAHTLTEQLETAQNTIALQHAVRKPTFWWLAAAFSLSTFATISMSVHLIPYLTEQGFSGTFAAGILGLVGGSQIPGRLIFTPLGNRVSRKLLTTSLFAMQVVALLVLITVQSEAGVLIFAILFGSGSGASSPARAALLAEIYGSTHYGKISGAQTLVMTFVRSVAPVAMGSLYGFTGSYLPVLITLTIITIGAVVAMLILSGIELHTTPNTHT